VADCRWIRTEWHLGAGTAGHTSISESLPRGERTPSRYNWRHSDGKEVRSIRESIMRRGRVFTVLLVAGGVPLLMGFDQRLPALLAFFNQRAAASALSSGRVLNAMNAFGAALCTVFTTVSSNHRLFGGSRMPPPITTQS
jgi:hypothetical protein